MYFQVNISPAPKPKPVKNPVMEADEVPVLSLAPFTRIPKVCFENVLVNTYTSKSLVIHNPTPNDITLYITKAPPEERNFTLSWAECLIRCNEKITLELFWQPLCEGGWKDTLSFEDGGRLKKDVAVIFKSIKPKKAKVKPKKVVKCISTKVMKSPKRWLSPKQKATLVKPRRSVLPDVTDIPRIILESPWANTVIHESTYSIRDKENLEISGVENLSYTSSVSNHPNKITKPPKGFCNYIGENDSNGSEENFDDSLERKKNPLSIEDKLNAIVFTPTQDHFEPSFCSTGEKTRILGTETDLLSLTTCNITKKSPRFNLTTDTYVKCTERVLNISNTSSATYNIDKHSPGVNIEDRLLNISSDTFIKGNISSSTYTKDGIQAELNFSGRTPSPIPFESNQNFCYDGIRQKHLLEQILEESHVSSDVSQVNRTESRKRRSENYLRVTSPKRRSHSSSQCIEDESFRTGAVPKRSFKAVKALNLKEAVRKSRETLATVEESTVLQTYNARSPIEQIAFPTHNPFILTAVNSIDPFMSGTMYYDPRWVDEQENGFKKWLNALLTPPAELNSNAESVKVDVAKLWQDCKKRDVSKAPTKEAVSSKYHTKNRLDSLRRSSSVFFKSPKIAEVLSKVCAMIENQRLVIRDDRDVHLDLGLQAEIVGLFLCYNPLWLRIALETVYNTAIQLHSNSDVVGLVMFLSEHFFKDQYLLKKYKSVHAKKYATDIKKLILKRFLMLIYFLDRAKESKLIPHDPCLFCKNSPVKESRDIILKFSREVLSSIGDVTKVLKHTGYQLTHKQTYINEFDYAVNNLGGDLRDGVRLARVMEIILIVEGLTEKLRVPAISRLQKVHNLRVVFDALRDSGFEILHEIEPKDIVDGHKEKTLSFLWQIIYKFQAPRITKAVVRIQTFWRSLRVVIKRRILHKERIRKDRAALKIQRWYRRTKLSQKITRMIPAISEILLEIRRNKAATLIQTRYRSLLTRRWYLNLRETVIKLQSHCRRFLAIETINARATATLRIQSYFRMHVHRKRYLKLKASARLVEEKYIAQKLMTKQLESYRKLKSTTLFVQTKFRAKLAMMSYRDAYSQLKSAAILIQRRFRANILMRSNRNDYLTLKTATIFVQQRFRANKYMIIQKMHYQHVKSSAILIQRYFRAKQQMRIDQNRYRDLKQAALTLQTRFRANKEMRIQKEHYHQVIRAAVTIQRRYRAKMTGELARKRYLELKSAVGTIEKRFLAMKLMKEQRMSFLRLKGAVAMVEEKFIAKKLANNARESFVKLRTASVLIQRKFRAQKQMRIDRLRYVELRNASVVLQRRFRANQLCKNQRRAYIQLREAVKIVQTRYRANILMRVERHAFLELRKAAVILQRRYRAKILGRACRNSYFRARNSVKFIQTKYRAKRLARQQIEHYTSVKRATVLIQRRFREYILMKEQRHLYLLYRKSVIVIQRRFRANIQACAYRELRSATTTIQRRFRANQAMKECRHEFVRTKNAVIRIQTWFRAMSIGFRCRRRYLQIRNAVGVVQQRYKAKKLAEIQSERYKTLRRSVITVQRRFRANKAAKIQRMEYLRLREATIVIQRWYIAQKLTRSQLTQFTSLKRAAVVIQRRFRSMIRAREQRTRYLQLKQAVNTVESRYKAKLLALKQSNEYTALRRSVIVIQRKFRRNTLMKNERRRFLELRGASVVIQRRFRAMMRTRVTQNEYRTLRRHVICVQNRYRANRAMRIERDRFRAILRVITNVQTRFRAKLAMREERDRYLRLRRAVVIVQRRYRARKLMVSARKEFLALKRAVLVVENRVSANNSMVRQRNEFGRLKTATLKIQIWFRSILAMRRAKVEYLTMRNCVIAVQRRFRANTAGNLQRQKYLVLIKSVVLIQRLWRAKIVVRKIRANIAIVQAYVRGFLARRMFTQRYLPILVENRKRREAEKQAATKIQACWRGHITRSLEKPELKEIREKVKIANEKVAPQKTLAYRKAKALDVMVNENSTLDQIIAALQDLDYETRLFKQSCFDLSRCLPEELYRMITTSSRSVPEMQSCTAATSILINFCKYPTTIDNCWYPEYVDSLLTVMMHWCDKDYPLFLHLSTLLWHLAQDPKRKRFIKSVPTLPHKLSKIKQLCERKHKMSSKVHYKACGEDIFATYKSLPAPSTEPDWGLDYKKRPRTFRNAVHAMRSLLAVLDL